MKYTVYQRNGEDWVALYEYVAFDDLPESIQRANYLLCAVDRKECALDVSSEIVGYCDRREHEDGHVLLFFEQEVKL